MNTVAFHIIVILNFIRLLILEGLDLILCGVIFGYGKLMKDETSKLYARNNAKAIDLRGNAALYGDPQETISSRLGRSRNKEKHVWVRLFRNFVDTLFFFDYDIEEKTGRKIKHCEKSIDPNIKVDEELWNWNKDGKDSQKK